MGTIPLLASSFAIDWGWLRIGPYIHLNIDPIIFSVGPLAVRWYGLMYVVAIIVGLWAIRGYVKRKGIDEDAVYRILWWCIGAGVLGGRLYFVIQQDNLVDYYLKNPINIIAVWQGGMAFFGAIFLIIPTLIWRAHKERINPLVLIDAGVLFGAAGQIFGRIGNIINGDIIGYQSTLPWSFVYDNPNSWACLNPATCRTPVQPAAVYELLTNVVVLVVLFYLARRVKRPGIVMLVYLFSYAVTQFFLFFVRDNVYVKFFGLLDWHLKQTQWTSIVVFLALIPITFYVLRSRYSQPIPEGEVWATYGIPQKPLHVDDEEDEADVISNIDEPEKDPIPFKAENAPTEPAVADTPEPKLDEQPEEVKADKE